MNCTHDLKKCYLHELNDNLKMCVLLEINDSTNINFSLSDALRILQEYQSHDQNVNTTTEIILIIIYILMMISGFLTNLIISFVVVRKTQMHTPRNLYIVNLAASDTSLCIICMPFTLVSIIQRHWDLGQVMCKVVPTLQGTNIFVSVGTITVIALDRYATIVCRQDVVNTRKRVITSIFIIWVVSALATAPVFIYQRLVSVGFYQLVLYETCVEVWPSDWLKVCYTASILLIQAVIPVVVVGAVHLRIAGYLHSHALTQHDMRRVQREVERNHRTTLLLSIVAILFALSWLPLSIFSLLVDVLYPAESSFGKVSPQSLYTAFAICHIIAMTSTTSNPVIYGWLNSNIRQEFLQMLQSKCSTSNEEVLKHSPLPVTRAMTMTTQTVPEVEHPLATFSQPIKEELIVKHTIV